MTGMDATPDPSTFSPVPPPHAPHTGLDSFFDSIRRIGIVRTDSRWIGGVSGGLARRLGIDVALTRGILLVLAIFGGLGLVVYGAAWALLPEERDGRIHLQEAIRGNVDGAIVGAIALVVLGAARPDSVWPTSFFPWGRLESGISAVFGALVVAGIVVLIVRAVGSNKKTGASVGPVALPRTGGPVAPAAGIVQDGMAMDRDPTPRPGIFENAVTGSAAGADVTAVVNGTSAAAAPIAISATQQLPPSGGYPPYAAAYQAGQTPYHAGPTPYGHIPPTGYGPPVPPSPYAQAPVALPTAPRKVRVRGPGRTTLGVVVALDLLVTAGLLLLDRAGKLSATPWDLAAGAFLVLLGLGIVAAGLRGRRSGFLGFLAIVAIALTPFTTWSSGDWSGVAGPHVSTGTQTYRPIDRATAADGFSLGVGESRIDLSGVPLTSEQLTVPIRIGVGDLTVVVPHGAAVEAKVRLQAGELDWNVDPDHQQISGTGMSRTLTSQSAAGRTPNLVLDIRAGAAQVTIEEN